MSEDHERQERGGERRADQLFHFVTAADEDRQLFSFCCENQPLATVRSHGLPVRCPFCQQANPVGGEQETGGEADVPKPHSRARSNPRAEERCAKKLAWHPDLDLAIRETCLCLDTWQSQMNWLRELVAQHETFTPDAFRASLEEMMPEFQRATRAAASSLQIMAQIKSGEVGYHEEEPQESSD